MLLGQYALLQAAQVSEDPYNVFQQLDLMKDALTGNSQSIAAMLASPVLLEYQHACQLPGLGIAQWGPEAVRLMCLLGASLASVLVPVLLPGRLGASMTSMLWSLPGVYMLCISVDVAICAARPLKLCVVAHKRGAHTDAVCKACSIFQKMQELSHSAF